jgi:hypothetical protein
LLATVLAGLRGDGAVVAKPKRRAR